MAANTYHNEKSSASPLIKRQSEKHNCETICRNTCNKFSNKETEHNIYQLTTIWTQGTDNSVGN